jgi:hypothetical protein
MRLIETILKIVRINGKKLSSVNEYLKIVGEFSKSYCVILWELNAKTEHLTTLAHWFLNSDQYPSIHDLPKGKSLTGFSLEANESQYCTDMRKDGRIYSECAFWIDYNIYSFVTIPITFRDGNKGALNVYSKKVNGFNEVTRKNLAILAAILPDFFQSLRNNVTYNLIENVDAKIKLSDSLLAYKGNEVEVDQIRLLFEQICKEVSVVFNCFETSIFLKNPFDGTLDYHRMASTWQPNDSQKVYKADKNDGLTGWILANKREVKITDLLLFDEQKHFIRSEYPDITWHARGNIRRAVSEILNITDTNQKLPPMGFMGAPIGIGDEIFGVIRCCACLEGPYYFGSSELEMLNLIAVRLSHTWKNFIQTNLINEDIGAWEKVVIKISELDKFVIYEIEKEVPNIFSIFEKALTLLPELIRDAEITDVRLLDKQRENLYFAAFFGEAWDSESTNSGENLVRRQKKFSVLGNSAGAKVFKSGETLVLDPIKEGDSYEQTFNGVKKLIVAPLQFGQNVFGV